MQAQIAAIMSKLQEEPAQQDKQAHQTASLQAKISSWQKLWRKR